MWTTEPKSGCWHLEARLGRAETAPDTGVVDEHVCSIESITNEDESQEYKSHYYDKKTFDWIHECMDNWVHEVDTVYSDTP